MHQHSHLHHKEQSLDKYCLCSLAGRYHIPHPIGEPTRGLTLNDQQDNY